MGDEEEDEVAKWQKWERGVRRRSHIALPHSFAFKGFWETISAICASPNSLKWHGGPLPGLSHNHDLYRPFISAICYGSPNIRRLLRQLLWLSNYYYTAIPLVFSL